MFNKSESKRERSWLIYVLRTLIALFQAGVFKLIEVHLSECQVDWHQPLLRTDFAKKKKKNLNLLWDKTNYCDFLTTVLAVLCHSLCLNQRKITHVSHMYIKSLHHSRTCYNNFKCFINIIIIIYIQRSIKYMNKTIYINFYTHKSHGIRVIGRDEIINETTICE